ncbi:MAG TPA: hypothetical protein VGO76_15095 [Luteibacter sp.]|nr:hypothetical protein [Luteibacter sp.]
MRFSIRAPDRLGRVLFGVCLSGAGVSHAQQATTLDQQEQRDRAQREAGSREARQAAPTSGWARRGMPTSSALTCRSRRTASVSAASSWLASTRALLPSPSVTSMATPTAASAAPAST